MRAFVGTTEYNVLVLKDFPSGDVSGGSTYLKLDLGRTVPNPCLSMS